MTICFKQNELETAKVSPCLPEFAGSDFSWELRLSDNSHDYNMEVVVPLNREWRDQIVAELTRINFIEPTEP